VVSVGAEVRGCQPDALNARAQHPGYLWRTSSDHDRTGDGHYLPGVVLLKYSHHEAGESLHGSDHVLSQPLLLGSMQSPVFDSCRACLPLVEEKPPRHRAASSAAKFGSRRALNLDGAERMPSALPLTGAGNSQKIKARDVPPPRAPRASLLGFPWKPANVYLPRSTMHPWRCIHNGPKVAARMARTCRSI